MASTHMRSFPLQMAPVVCARCQVSPSEGAAFEAAATDATVSIFANEEKIRLPAGVVFPFQKWIRLLAGIGFPFQKWGENEWPCDRDRGAGV